MAVKKQQESQEQKSGNPFLKKPMRTFKLIHDEYSNETINPIHSISVKRTLINAY